MVKNHSVCTIALLPPYGADQRLRYLELRFGPHPGQCRVPDQSGLGHRRGAVCQRHCALDRFSESVMPVV